MKFEFTPKELTAEAYGNTFTLPKKTPVMLASIAEIDKKLLASPTAREQTEVLIKGIGCFIGEEEAAKLFPCIDDVDTDEVSAFWMFLKNLYASASNDVIEKYSANRAARRAK